MNENNQKDTQLDDILMEIRLKRELEETSRRKPRTESEKPPLEPPPPPVTVPGTAVFDSLAKPVEAVPGALSTQEAPEHQTGEATLEIDPPQELKTAAEIKGDKDRPSRFNLRSLKAAFTGDEDGVSDTHVNKQMLAPTLVPEETDLLETDEIEVPGIFQESHNLLTKDAEAPEKHPLFSASAAQPTAIPPQEEAPDGAARSDEAAAKSKEIKERIFEKTEEIRKKGVLNVKENIDDEEFKTFFSNTVVIDSKPLSQRGQKPKRITDFIVGEDGGPVFEEPVVEKDGSLSEYRSDDETEQVMSFLSKRNTSLLIRTFISGFAALLLLALNLLSGLESLTPGTFMDDAGTMAAVNAALIIIAVAANYRSIFKGFAKLVTFKADADSVISASAILCVLEPLAVYLLKSDNPVFFAPAAAAASFFSLLGKKISAKRVLSGFLAISADYEKYAAVLLDDDAFSKRLTRSLTGDGSRVLVKRKTGFTDDFLTHSKSRDDVNRAVSLPASVLFILALICGLIVYFLRGDALAAIQSACLASVLITPFTSTLASALPIDRMQRELLRIGCAVPGFSAADAVVDSNCVVLEGREIFPRGNVLLHGIKTFNRERIDKAILYAASVLIQSCDTMSHMFLNVIQNKTEMLYETDNIIYEDGLGFSCWIDKARLLIGTRELLESRDIEVPSRDYENRYTKSSTRDAIYLAVSGKLYAMFVVSYAPGAEVERAMRGFEREGVSVLVRTRDFNITSEKIARSYKIPRAMISIVEEHDMEELAKKTAYISNTPSLFTHIGSLSSYVGGILSCYRLRSTLKLSTTIELASMVIGGLLALLLAVFDPVSFSAFSALLLQSFWLIITVAANALRRYA